MHISTVLILSLAAVLAVCVLALSKGGTAERHGAMIVLGTTMGVWLIHIWAPQDIQAALLLGIDGLIAGGFLLIAMRYASVWLGGAMLFQSVQFSLHAYYLVTQQRLDHNYKLINNIDSFGVLLCILIGTLLAWRKRVAAAK